MEDVRTPPNTESFAHKASRELGLITQGADGFFAAASQSMVKGHRLKTGGELAASAAAGIGLAYLTRGHSTDALIGKTVAAVGGVSFLTECAKQGSTVAGALKDAWHSDANWNRDAEIMRGSVGRFAFDTALMSFGGIAGGLAGHAMFRPKIPPLFFDQMSDKTGIRQDYYNKLYGAEFRTDTLINNTGPFSASKVAEFQARLPQVLKNVQTYSDYWDHEIGAFERANQTKLDARGIKAFLVNSRPSARKLDSLAEDIRGYADKDLNNPSVLNELADKFQQSRRVIYGNDPHQARRFINGPDLLQEPSEGRWRKFLDTIHFHPMSHA